MKRKEVLKKAGELIDGARDKEYGEAIINHARIAKGWDIIAKAAIKKDGFINPAHVVLMMDWVKTSRLLETIEHKDSWVDKAGYTALGAEFSTEND